ncbi:MAG: hypothetical protein IJT27_08100 [Clostridia bacterium]|nr:hypothetical protein [Clostridia bacterium]
MLDVFSVDSLIRPPKLTGENAKIQSAFEEHVGSDVTLINPLMGSFRSAFVFYDFDGDGVEEVVVFYTTVEAPNEVRMHFMDRLDDQWMEICDLAGYGSEVYSVEFVDLDAGSFYEVAVSWTVSDSRRNKTLSVYRYTEIENDQHVFSPLFVTQVLDYLILDFDLDENKEILYLYSDTTVQTQSTKACLIKFDAVQNTMTPVSEVELSRSVEYPVSSVYEVRSDVCRVYFDCLNFDDRYMTEILEFNEKSNALERPRDKDGNDLCQQTMRSAPVYCRVNADGLVEIPVSLKYDGAYVYDLETDAASDLYLTTFAFLRENDFFCDNLPVYYIDASDGYSIRLADGEQIHIGDFTGKYLLIHRTAQHTLLFYHKEFPGDLVFSITFNPDEDTGDEIQPSHIYQASVKLFSTAEEDTIAARQIEQNIKLLQG